MGQLPSTGALALLALLGGGGDNVLGLGLATAALGRLELFLILFKLLVDLGKVCRLQGTS